MLMIFIIVCFEIQLWNDAMKLTNLSIALLTYINILDMSRGEIPEIQ